MKRARTWIAPTLALSLAGALSVIALSPSRTDAAETAKTTVAPASKKLVIVGEGKGASGLVDAARKLVPEGWDVRPATELALSGKPAALWAALDSSKQRAGAIAKVRAALASKQLDAALLVQVTATKKGRVAHVVLVTRADEDAPVDEKLALPAKPSAKDDDELRAVIVAPLVDRAPKPDPAAGEVANPDEYASKTEAAPTTTANASPQTADDDPPPREPMLVLGAMGELAARRFTYDGTTIGGLRPYNLPNVAAIGVAAELYPLRDVKGLVSGLGVAGDFHTSIGLKSTAVGSNEQSTARWTRFDAMLRWWVPLVASHVTAVGVSIGYGQERFAFSPPTPDLPSVAYEYARAGADFRLRLGKGDTSKGAAVSVGASYLLVVSGGEVSEHFRKAQTWGLEVTGGLSVYLSAAIEARLSVDYRRFAAKFSGAQAGDPFIASGALDEMVRTLFELRVKY